MRTGKVIMTMILNVSLCLGMMSCIVVHKHDNGKHKGWFKNPNNPHHPGSKNPGHNKKEKHSEGGEHKGKSKGKSKK